MEKLDKQASDSLRKNIENTLKNYVGEDKMHNLEGAVTAILDVQGTYCKCQHRKCSPHRCWPSMIAWSFVIGLLAIVWCVQSSVSSESNKAEIKLSNYIKQYDENRTSVESRLASIETAIKPVFVEAAPKKKGKRWGF